MGVTGDPGNRAPAAMIDADALYQHGPMLLAAARFITLDHAEAEDLVQTTFEIAIRRLGDLRDPMALRAWLLRIQAREAFRVVRRLRRGPAGEAAPRRIESSADGLVAYGSGDGPGDAVWVSADGAAWTQLAPLPVGSVSAVALRDGRVLVAGSAAENPPGLWVAVGQS